MSQPDLLTLAQVAERLQVSRWTVYQLIWAGELRSVHIGRCHRVRATRRRRLHREPRRRRRLIMTDINNEPTATGPARRRKRGNGEGTISKRSDGRYTAAILRNATRRRRAVEVDLRQ